MNTIELIVKDVQNGQIEKYELIIEKFQNQLYKYVYSLVGDIHEAEDLLQDVFVKAYEKIDKYHHSNSFSAWLYKIAYNHSINFIRKRNIVSFVSKFDFTKVQSSNSKADEYLENIFDEKVEKTLAKLNIEEKNLLVLRIFQEKSFDEIGLILDSKPATARKKYERIRKKFQKYYKEIEGSDNIEQYAN